jgi:hypothetical protein
LTSQTRRLDNNQSSSFTNKKIRQQPIFINSTKVPYANTAKYLGMALVPRCGGAQHQVQENVLVAWTQF